MKVANLNVTRPGIALGAIAFVFCMELTWSASGDPPATGTSDPRGASTVPSDVMNVSALAFQTYLASLRDQAERAGVEPTLLEDALWVRINHHGEMIDQSVMTAVNCWCGYEGQRANKEFLKARAIPKNSFPQTTRLIDALLPVSQPWPTRVAYLHQRKAYLFQCENDWKGSITENELSIKAITPVGIDIDLRRLECFVSEGDAATFAFDKKRADAAYLNALSYDWPKIADPEGQHAAEDLYIAAGRGLIQIRRHNLALLKQIHFIPSTLDALGTDLDAAIKEAQEDPGR